MIVSEDIKLHLELPVTNFQIERFFKEKNLKVLRWAIIKAEGNDFLLKVSYEK